MNEKKLLDGQSGPATQSIESVKALLTFVGCASEPLPQDVSLDNGRMILVLSSKKDAYYTTTKDNCSCPSRVYRCSPCKHMQKFFPEQKPAAKPASAKSLLDGMDLDTSFWADEWTPEETECAGAV